jgi:HAD superfamily hydrolase (TIGR01509 family)
MIEMMELTESFEELLEESVVIFEELLEEHLQPMPGLFELLERIEARGLPKGVATSSRRHYLEDMLGRFGLLERFHTTLTAEDVTHGKPHPEIYLKAAERLGIDPGEMLVLEDSQAGTQSAAAAGAVVISVPHDHSRAHDFSVAHAIVRRLDDAVVLDLIG